MMITEYLSKSPIFCAKSVDEQARIHATIQDPVNVDLVKQLGQYLDPEFQTESNLTGKSAQELASDQSEPTDESARSESSGGGKPSSHSAGSSSSGSLFDRFNDLTESGLSEDVEIGSEDSETSDSDTGTEDMVDDAVEEPSESAEASTTIASSGVFACVNPEQLIGTLNVKEDTNGASRIKVADDEVWIYYNDKINLNNIMESVISTLSQSGFSSLEFNRLARSDNAIVFTADSDILTVTGADAE